MTLQPGDVETLERWEHAIGFRLFAHTSGQTLTVPEQIAAQVGDRILDGRLAPGVRVGEQELADEFAVSRGPVREAIRLLEREGLVNVLARRGAVVASPSGRELRELFEIRAGLFEIAVRKIGEDWPEELLAVMRAGVARLQESVEDPGGGDAYAELVHRLALITVCFAGNDRLRQLVAGLSLQTLRYSKLGLASVERRQRSIQLWIQALAAMERGDTEQVAKIVHLRSQESAAEASRLLDDSAGTHPKR